MQYVLCYVSNISAEPASISPIDSENMTQIKFRVFLYRFRVLKTRIITILPWMDFDKTLVAHAL